MYLLFLVLLFIISLALLLLTRCRWWGQQLGYLSLYFCSAAAARNAAEQLGLSRLGSGKEKGPCFPLRWGWKWAAARRRWSSPCFLEGRCRRPAPAVVSTPTGTIEYTNSGGRHGRRIAHMHFWKIAFNLLDWFVCSLRLRIYIFYGFYAWDLYMHVSVCKC